MWVFECAIAPEAHVATLTRRARVGAPVRVVAGGPPPPPVPCAIASEDAASSDEMSKAWIFM